MRDEGCEGHDAGFESWTGSGEISGHNHMTFDSGLACTCYYVYILVGVDLLLLFSQFPSFGKYPFKHGSHMKIALGLADSRTTRLQKGTLYR